MIVTPAGAVAVSALTAGASVWSLNGAGRRVAVPLVLVGSLPTPAEHTLVVFVLADGREVTASAGHPTADGRVVGELRTGDRLDGALVVTTRAVPTARN